MIRKFTKLLVCVIPFLAAQSLIAQTTITQWNFNSNPADASTTTGSMTASAGSGTLSVTGGLTPSFASGASNGGSSDPAAADNTGLGVTSFPAQGTGDKTAGIQFAVSTTGYQNIQVSFDLRHSNTGPRHVQFQYTTDISAATPVWTDVQVDAATGGDTWFPRSYNLAAVTALNNNANAAFRVVATFAPSTTAYAPSSTSSNYGTGGTWRFDMVTVKGATSGGDVVAPVAQVYQTTSSTTSFIKFSEPVSMATAQNTANYSFNPALAVSSATRNAGGDTVFLVHAPIVNGQAYTLTVANVQDAAGNTMSNTNFNVLYNAALPNLVITEIIHSPNDVEMIEVYNAGAAAINLGGLKWTDGTTGNFPSVSLAAGASIVFATSTTTASQILGVPVVYLINNGLGSSNDILVIRNSLNQVVDSVEYFVGTNGWPVAPVGVYAYSFELNNAAADNSLGANWSVPPNTVTPQPSQGIVRGTPGVYPAPPVAPATASVSFVGTSANVTETTTEVKVVTKIMGGGASASAIDLEVIPMSTATAGTDYTLPGSMQYNWVANANDVNDTITITINNDALAENTEYFIVRLTNPVNIAMPAAASNYFTIFIADNDKLAPVASQAITLNHLSSFSNGVSGTNSAEIVAHDPVSQRLFIANSIGAKIDIVNFDNPLATTLIASIPVTAYGNINSIAVKNGIVAAAIENVIPEDAGKVVFFDTNGVYISQVSVGAMPDMITFNHAGTKVLTANEGQPKADYTVDPEGSVSIVDISGGVATLTQANVTTAGFAGFNAQLAALKASGIRIFGPGATVAKDMEPEYITLSADDQTAWVTCQENNAIAVINMTTSAVTQILPLGKKDHMLSRNGLDVSDQGTAVQIANWPVKGIFMPDAIASYNVAGQTYLVTANEGDAREYSGLDETGRVGGSSYILDPAVFPYRDALKANIGRLNITTASGDTDGDGDFDEIHAYGGRSISIWNATTGALVWDSGDEMEWMLAKHPVFAALFNASNANNTLKNRSDDKGPEPEGVTLAKIGSRTYAFVALERMGGCMVYDVSNPVSPVFVDYKNTRTVASYGGDNGAEGIVYIDSLNSPTGKPIVILANEVSSTLSYYEVTDNVSLDVKLANINAVRAGANNRITWNTLKEDHGDVFEVERSADADEFTRIGTVNGKGNTAAYTFLDEQPLKGMNYYRLQCRNIAGASSYSKTVSVYMNDKDGFTLSIYPNPATDQLNVLVSSMEGTASVTIFNMNGLRVREQSLPGTSSVVNIHELPAGIYFIQYKDDRHHEMIKITKQ